MLLQPSDKRQPRRVELPLDTYEQIEHAQAVDDALERRARRRQEENKAEAGEIANEKARFTLLRSRVLFAISLILLALLMAAIIGLWLFGERIDAFYLLAGGGGLGGAGVWIRAGQST